MTKGRSPPHSIFCSCGHLRVSRDRSRPATAGFASATAAVSRSMSSGSAEHHRTGPARRRLAEGAGDEFGNRARRGRSRRPTSRPRREKARRSNSWNASRPRMLRPTCPTRRIIGVESCRPTWRPPEALVAPGPRVTMTMPGRPVSLPQASAAMAAPPSWRQTVTADRRIVERVEEGEVAFAGHAEDALDAVPAQRLGEDLATCPLPLRHPARSRR